MLREIWDHFNEAFVLIAGGAGVPVGTHTPLDIPFHQVDLWVSGHQDFNMEANVNYTDANGRVIMRLIHLTGHATMPHRVRLSFLRPVTNVEFEGVYWNRDPVNNDRVIAHISTMTLVRARESDIV